MNKILQLENVTKRYGDGASSLAVLKGITLDVSEGEAVSIVGPSGSGKSTLLNIMGGLDRPTAGSARLNDSDLANMNDLELSRVRNQELGFVFQFHHLLPHCTVMENILVPTLPSRAAAKSEGAADRGRELLVRVGLADRADYMPRQLSGGELQRVAVVRALINEPKLLLADEPTGSLDRASATELAGLLAELNEERGVTLVVVTHSDELAGQMGRHLTLVDGVLTE